MSPDQHDEIAIVYSLNWDEVQIRTRRRRSPHPNIWTATGRGRRNNTQQDKASKGCWKCASGDVTTESTNSSGNVFWGHCPREQSFCHVLSRNQASWNQRRCPLQANRRNASSIQFPPFTVKMIDQKKQILCTNNCHVKYSCHVTNHLSY